MTSKQHLSGRRDNLILVLLGLALLITFVADALGWFRTGPFFGR